MTLPQERTDVPYKGKQTAAEGEWRLTTQPLAPARCQPAPAGQYDIYPAFPVAPGSVRVGFDPIAEYVARHRRVMIDGYVGVMWESLRVRLDEALRALGVRAVWFDLAGVMKPEHQIDALIAPYLGGDDPLFGRRIEGSLRDLFDPKHLASIDPGPGAGPGAGGALTIVYGCGASLVGWDAPLIYVDLPKNELQFRSRAGSVRNLGASKAGPPKQQYKRFYFVDWVLLNAHKREIIADVDLFVDEQRPDLPASVSGDVVRDALARMSRNYFRVRPWFEPGPWGGQWIRQAIPQLPQDVPNYAWSFELIVPENGLMLADGEHQAEISFDWLMYHDAAAVIGDAADRFGDAFPIRFDFLDTCGGGNLSLQCHPRPACIREHFGEPFTQDECYYILAHTPGARVYLGFQGDVDPKAFRRDLEQSLANGAEVDVERYVQTHAARKHELFLIPSGTVHCSGEGNLVLEISATPYIFTFKMYDWLRMDLDGRPRPLNIARAFDNLRFDRSGERVKDELIAKPRVIEETSEWRLVHLPTHPEHCYDVFRYEFTDRITIRTDGSCHVMSLTEGESIVLETNRGMRQRFNYAETFVVPAAAEEYTLINESGCSRAFVVRASIKAGRRGSANAVS